MKIRRLVMNQSNIEELFLNKLSSMNSKELEDNFFKSEPSGFGELFLESRLFSELVLNDLTIGEIRCSKSQKTSFRISYSISEIFDFKNINTSEASCLGVAA